MRPQKIVRNKLEHILQAKNQDVKNWLLAKGSTGEITDALNSYFQTKTTNKATIRDMMEATLTALGYTGTFGDKINAFYVAKTGKAYPGDAARAFWSDITKDFN